MFMNTMRSMLLLNWKLQILIHVSNLLMTNKIQINYWPGRWWQNIIKIETWWRFGRRYRLYESTLFGKKIIVKWFCIQCRINILKWCSAYNFKRYNLLLKKCFKDFGQEILNIQNRRNLLMSLFHLSMRYFYHQH